MSDDVIPISAVTIDDETKAAVIRVLDSGHLAQGPAVAELERSFAECCEVEHAIAVNSGTTALVASLEALGIGPGDEVVTSPFTFAATLNAILETGATARFGDIDPSDFNITRESIAERVTDRTRVILPVDLYGQPAALDEIVDLARGVGARVVEDAAQSLGARFDGTPTGAFDVGCFSLYATKNVTTGEGGMITTHDAALADALRVLRNQGMRARYEYVVPGHNYRMTDLQAAVGLPQLRRLDEITRRRNEHATGLCERLRDVPGVVVPEVADRRTHAFHQFTIRVTPACRVSRDQLVEGLAARGVGAGIYYPAVVFDHACYRGHPQVVTTPTREATRAAAEVLSLPVHPGLRDGDLDRIADAVRGIAGDDR
jgi:dTDP-4-amino-4,6-dideoxygalactose transaminase